MKQMVSARTGMFISEIIIILKEKMRGGNHNFKEAQTTVEFLLGPIKIKDGLFMGDHFAAKVFVA